MSSFDNAFHRQASEARDKEDLQRARSDSARARADAAVPKIQQMVSDFLRTVSAQIKPERYGHGTYRFLFIKLPRYSPKGYLADTAAQWGENHRPCHA